MTVQSTNRELMRTLDGVAASDGAGVKLRRYIGTEDLPELDPILLLDEFRTDGAEDYLAGFPDHPHRGFETVTYMLHGRMRHQDNKGNRGLLESGGAQWMTAGSGLIHSEMPEQSDGLLWGYQLWLNLAAEEKPMPPAYWDLPVTAIPTVPVGSRSQAVVIAGELLGTWGPTPQRQSEPLYWDLQLEPDEELLLPVPNGHVLIAFVCQGDLLLAHQPVRSGQLAVFGDGSAIEVRTGPAAARVLLIGGKPLREPVSRYGPFVMNTREEIQQAFADYRAGRM
jgi:redox-sensitive bicupin YhaK (pirin superfamily)